MKASMKAKPGRRRQLSATFAGHICVELQGNLGIRIVGCSHNSCFDIAVCRNAKFIVESHKI